MRPTVTAAMTAVAGLATIAIIAVAGGTLAAFTATTTTAAHTVSTATVVLGRENGPVRLEYRDLDPSAPQTIGLTLRQDGSVPVDVDFSLPSGATSSACGDGQQDADALRIRFGAGDDLSYCSILQTGAAHTLVTALAPGATMQVPVTVTLSRPIASSRIEEAALLIRASDGHGFSDRAWGTILVSTAPGPSGSPGPTSTTPTPATSTPPTTDASSTSNNSPDGAACGSNPTGDLDPCPTTDPPPPDTEPSVEAVPPPEPTSDPTANTATSAASDDASTPSGSGH